MGTDLKIFTLNCWGIPVVSKNLKQRMKAIGEHLAANDYDIVCLQEVWNDSDFDYLKKAAENSLPFAHYFHSGVFGSGTCVLSRYLIEEAFFHQWSVNGYVHKLQHGDWYGGKGVGLCKIRFKSFIINVYSAHLHAEYNRKSDEYKAHRIFQAFDTAQFIRLTSGCAHLIVLAGDLNTEPEDLAYRILLNASGMRDSCLLSNSDIKLVGTIEGSRNSYSPKKIVENEPNGKRIDYVLFRTQMEEQVDVIKYEFALPERIPNETFSYSDHEALQVTFRLPNSSIQCTKTMELTESYILALKESIHVCEEALHSLKRSKVYYWIFAIVLTVLLIGTANIRVPFGYNELLIIAKLIIAFILFYSLVMATLWNCVESNALKAGVLTMEVCLLKMNNRSEGLSDTDTIKL